MTWKKIDSKPVYENHWVEARLDRLQLASLAEIEHFTLRKKQNGAVLLLENDQMQYAILSIYRYPIDEVIWQFPVEGIEVNEDDMQAALRGAVEEVHMHAQTIEKLGEFHVDPGGLIQKAKVFLLRDLKPLQPSDHQEPAEQESIHAISWLELAELDTMVANQQIRDAWTMSSLLLLKQYLMKG